MNRKISTASLVTLLALVSFVIGCIPEPTTPEPGQVITIPELKGPAMERYIGETVTVEAIFVRDPVPMLVTDLDLVLMNMPIPDDQFILLSGDEAERMDPEELGGARLRVTGTANAPDDGDENGTKILYLDVSQYEMLDRLTPYAPNPVALEMIQNPNPDPRRYAILFSGGINAAQNHYRYWNDLKFMYKTLVGTLAFPKNNVVVLYAGGNALDTDMPVHYSATQANLQTVFSMLRQTATTDDLVFVFTTNHGGGFRKKDPSKKYMYGGQWDAGADEPGDSLAEKDYKLDLNGNGNKTDTVSWDEELHAWQGHIFDDAFHAMVGNLNFDRMVIVMEQCFSGGLIHDMAQGGNRIIISAAGEYEPSWPSTSQSFNYDEFSYHFTCAINKADPKGNKVDADADNDGLVSLVEAFNYARSKDAESETPWYEDSGDGIPHSDAMPSHGEGTLGGNTTLEP